jgi:hypothetical protein
MELLELASHHHSNLAPVTTIYQMLQKTILQMATHQRDMRVEM